MTAPIAIRRLNAADPDFARHLDHLLSWESVSDDSVNQRVLDIIKAVRERGDAALVDFTRQFDGLDVKSMADLILPRERSSKNDGDGKSGAEAAKEALENLLPPKLKGAHDFYKACGGRLLMMASYAMISQYTLYIFENYVGLTVQEAAKAMGTLSAVTFVVSLIGLAV